MRRILGLIGVGLAIVGVSFGQIKKQFSVDDSQTCEKIKLKLKANSGTCYLKPSHNPEILTVFSNTDQFSHQLSKDVSGSTCEVMLSLEEAQSEGLSSTISYKVFGSEKPVQEKFWK